MTTTPPPTDDLVSAIDRLTTAVMLVLTELQKPKPKRGRPPKNKAASTEKPQANPAEGEKSPETPAEPPVPAITQDHVREALTAFLAVQGDELTARKEVIAKIQSEFGVAKFSQLDPAHYAQVLARLSEVA